MTRQRLQTMKPDEKTSAKLGFLAEYENRSKLDELRFLINKRMSELKIKEGIRK